MLARLLTTDVFALLLVFARLGAAIMVMPGIGESFVSARIRLLFALALTVIAAPMVALHLPPIPQSLGPLTLLLGSEIGVGIFIGLIMRILASALETCGTIISFQTGLSSALIFNPSLSSQGSLTGLFLSMVGIILLFETNLEQIMLRGVIDSYALFQPGNLPPIGDFSETIARVGGQSLRIGMQLASPFILLPTLMFIGTGIFARIMPQLQIFFITLPLQLVLGFLLLSVSLSTMLMVFLNDFQDHLNGLLAPP